MIAYISSSLALLADEALAKAAHRFEDRLLSRSYSLSLRRMDVLTNRHGADHVLVTIDHQCKSGRLGAGHS
jgi:hypothetical protein